MSAISEALSGYQTYLEETIPGLPKQAVQSIFYSFGLSFTVSLILSGNPTAALCSGTLSALAILVHGTIVTVLNKIESYIEQRYNKKLSRGDALIALPLGVFVSVTYLGMHLFGSSLNLEASFLMTIPLIFWNMWWQEENTPIMSIVIA